jgi:hypothetical protein
MRDRLLRDGFVVLAIVFAALRLFSVQPWAESVDAFAYWSTRTGDFYTGAATGQIGAYLYSPAFAQALRPLVFLPWPVFAATWTCILMATYWWLVDRRALALLLFLPIPFEIISGNVHLLYAAAIVVGFRWPAAWALMLLTKVTPGIGILWFLARREWRAFFVAVGASAAIAAVSYILDPRAWAQWVDLLRGGLATAGNGTVATVGWYLPVPLLPRLVVAAIVVVVAARSNRPWLVPIGVVLAMPVVWLNSLSVLVAAITLRGRTEP